MKGADPLRQGRGNMQSRRFSLTLAKQFRTCPPPAVRDDPNQRQEYEEHLAVCPYCSAPDTAEREAWEMLGRHLEQLTPAIGQTMEKVMPGQLRFVRHDLACWRARLFYTPPLVVVIDNVHAVSDDILVAQTYFDLSMAGPGDLILTDRQTPVGDLFVETWNVYTLKAADLGASPGAIDSGIMSAIKQLQENPDAYPDWAMIPRPFSDQDPRIYFRELEVEVGYVFSSPSVSRLMTELETPVLKLVHESTDALQGTIRKVVPGVCWKRPCPTREEVLALLELPTESLPLAADESVIERFSANGVRLKGGEVASIEPFPVEIHGQSGSLVLSGRVRGLPRGLKRSEFISFLDLKGMGALSPVRYEWKESTGDFLIEFDLQTEAPWRLKVAVLFEPAGP
jgi:hypothetical protein